MSATSAVRHDRLEDFNPPPQGCVLSIGNFDGVHRGHARLVERAREAAEWCSAPVVVATFDPHPLALLSPQRAPAALTTMAERVALLGRLGASAVVVLRTDWALLNQTADEFLTRICRRCSPRAIVEGPTFNFGRGRTGNVETLRHRAADFGYEAILVDELECAEVAGKPAINSSAIREAIGAGRVENAAAMLGRPYRIVGAVGRGRQRGTRIGFPTANLEHIEQMIPAEAVYAAAAQMDDGALRLTALSIGSQPTFGETTRTVEAHLLDFSGDLYGRRLGLHLLGRVRGQVKFDSVDELTAQIRRDVERVRQFADQVERLSRSSPIGL